LRHFTHNYVIILRIEELIMKDIEKTVRLSVTLDEEIHKILKKYVDENGMTINGFTKIAILNELKKRGVKL